jgi:hypothetical protein
MLKTFRYISIAPRMARIIFGRKLAAVEHNLSNRLSMMEKQTLRRRAAAATVAVLLLPPTAPLQARSRGVWGDSSGTGVWRRVSVKILARGSSAGDSTGNMDSYLVLLFGGKNREPVAARLVDYYPRFQMRLTDEVIMSRGEFRVSVTPAPYCEMDAAAFVVKHAFYPEAIGKVQGNLPCVIVRH